MSLQQQIISQLEGNIRYLPNNERPNELESFVPLSMLAKIIEFGLPKEDFIIKIIQLSRDYLSSDDMINTTIVDYVKKHLND